MKTELFPNQKLIELNATGLKLGDFLINECEGYCHLAWFEHRNREVYKSNMAFWEMSQMVEVVVHHHSLPCPTRLGGTLTGGHPRLRVSLATARWLGRPNDRAGTYRLTGTRATR